MSVKKSVKQKLSEQMGRKCVKCGIGKSCPKCKMDNILTVDHILAKQFGGTDDISNLQYLCVACHKYKTRLEVYDKFTNEKFLTGAYDELLGELKA